MKKNKKILILGLILGGIVAVIIYKQIESMTDYEEIGDVNIIIENEETINVKDEEEANEEFIVLHITGEVKNPGVIRLKPNSRIIDAIEEAGGLTEHANINKVNLAYMVSDGQKIYIPSINDEDSKELITEDGGESIVINDFKQKTKVNINTATQAELETVTGIGPSTALKIINYRKENGKFKTIEDIKNVSGIGDAKFETIKNEICV